MINKSWHRALASAVIFLVSQCVYASMYVTPILQNGFYIGADIGAANLMDQESHSVNPESHQLGNLGLIGGGFIGYDFCVSDYLRLAIEGFVDFTQLNTQLKHASFTYQMNQYSNLGVRLLPEFIITPFTVGHLIIGYANGRFNIKDNGVYGIIDTNYRRSGFQLGVGATTVLTNQVFLRLDVLYNNYASNTNTGLSLVNSGSSTQSYTNRFSQLAGEIALIYKFC